MSQVRRQAATHHFYNNDPNNPNDNAGDSRHSSSRPPRSPTASPVSAGNLIPRDYLGPRNDSQSQQQMRMMRPDLASSGKSPAAPAPLNTTNLPSQSSRRGGSDSPQMSPASSSTNPAASPFQNGRPPITQIADAAFPAPPSSTGHAPSKFPVPIEKKSADETSYHRDGDISRTPRKQSTRASSTQSATSSPKSEVISSQTMPGDPSKVRNMPRTSSIDSAISSLSSATQSQKSTFDASSVSAADIGHLISAAGSAEAVIVHLLKEKHSAASQNSQLWRLVDKQRTLILGLNKDLERSMKEKEKYKQRFKDLQSAAPRVPKPDAPIRQPPATDAGRPAQGDSDSQTQSDQTEKPIPGLVSRDFQASVAAGREWSRSSPVSSASPSSAHSKKDGVPHPSRKPPPAPLNLRQAESATRERRQSFDSESDYEDILEVDKSPVKRGRRKTREEDDEDREAAIERDTTFESVSGAKHDDFAKASGVSETSRANVQPAESPPSPRQMTAQFPPIAERTQSPESIFGPGIAQVGSLNQPAVPSAPKSPGLPMSPRPEDRPPGAPLPRMPREAAHTSDDHGSGALPHGTGRVANPVHPSSSGTTANEPPSTHSVPSIDDSVKIGSTPPHSATRGIYRGFVSDEYPNLLLPPNVLPLVQVKVSSSRLRPSRNSYMGSKSSDEEPVFTLSISSRSEGSELWRVEKVIAALPQLDQQVRRSSALPIKLPDRSIFSGHSPAKMDARRASLNAYFGALLDTPLDDKAAYVVCQFLSADAIEPRDDETTLLGSVSPDKPATFRGPDGRTRREGYLTKRGKNFGGWKARYFVLHGPELKYFESPGGPHLGTIKIYNAQIGKQSEKAASHGSSPSQVEDDSENQYRHAFLILEPKRKDSSALVRHVLCAESDEERDAWVEALLEYVEDDSSDIEDFPSQPQGQERQRKLFSSGSKRGGKRSGDSEPEALGAVQGFSFDDAAPAAPPVFGPSYENTGGLKSPQTPSASFMEAASQMSASAVEAGQPSPHPIISGPTNGSVIQNAGAWGNKAATSAKEKKRSIWGFRTRSSYDLASQMQANYEASTANQGDSTPTDRKEFIRPVFGMPLGEAVQYCAPRDVNVGLPAVVYRCIEYLEAKGAASEEGIFRLSGSNIVIKALKERFNTEGDVDFLADDQYYDVHAVASLFKQYLRELPTSVLTRELHLEFLRVLGKL